MIDTGSISTGNRDPDSGPLQSGVRARDHMGLVSRPFVGSGLVDKFGLDDWIRARQLGSSSLIGSGFVDWVRVKVC